MKKLKKVLNGSEDNHLFPFFWIHGESEETLREYVNKVYETGIKAICVESRPHNDYLGEQWWHDLEIIIDEAKKNKMKVWLLDDEHFPTGYAAGKIIDEYPHLQKLYLKMDHKDVIGPKRDVGINVNWALEQGRGGGLEVGIETKENKNKNKIKEIPSKIIKVIAAKKIGYEKIDENSFVDLTKFLKDGIVRWNIPQGEWSIFTFVQTTEGGEEATAGYLNPLVSEATDVLLQTVYESHFEKLGDEFGETIVGFFSDEPRFGNVKGPEASIGRMKMQLPWRADLLKLLNEEFELDFSTFLPLLFLGESDKANKIRYYYMEYITKLFSKNFSERIGNWCEAHDVKYIGHVIEDNNAHSRLGYGAGHFFRSMKGQHMAGIDIVLHQLLPGFDKGYFKSYTSTGWDGEFFHYGLAKLGSSLGHLDETKNGQTMAEVFGAYGWGEGLRLMKWIADHMLVRGVNEFVPHSFTLKNYPDPDCPPHLYAHGNNPQYRYTSELVNYMNRISTLLSDGRHVAPVGLLYHAEAEWSGNYMLFQKPARELTQNQIDFDVIPAEYIEKAIIKSGKYIIGDEEFSTLVVPYSEALPYGLIKKINKLMENNIRVIFIDKLPTRSSENIDIQGLLKGIFINKYCKISNLNELSMFIKKQDLQEIETREKEPYLRYYHYSHDDGEIYFLTNEDPYRKIKTKITISENKKVFLYDAFTNKAIKLNRELSGDKTVLNLEIDKYESKILIFTNKDDFEYEVEENKHLIKTKLIDTPVEISFSKALDYPNFTKGKTYPKLKSMELNEELFDYSGTIRYNWNFKTNHNKFKKAILDINGVSEVVEVFLNNKKIGVKISDPYKYDISDSLKNGNNNLIIEVTNTLGNEQKDYLSQYLLKETIGINGEVSIQYYK